jgi:hypothetical protein
VEPNYEQIWDGKEFVHNIENGLLLKCCGCGLVHRILFRPIGRKKIGMTFYVMEGDVTVDTPRKEKKRVQKVPVRFKQTDGHQVPGEGVH